MGLPLFTFLRKCITNESSSKEGETSLKNCYHFT
jgi:hypothetical protein